MKKLPKVLNKKIDEIPSDAVYVARPSKWGNPWRIGEKHPIDGHPLTRDDVIELYRCNISQMLKTKRDDGSVILNLSELQGKDLVCFCSPLPCHADILLRLANKGD